MDAFGIFGVLGFVFGMVAYSKLIKLEKHLKKSGVLERDYK